MLAGHEELKHKIETMEKKYDQNFQVVFEAIKQLLEVETRPNRRIGFTSEKPVPIPAADRANKRAKKQVS